MRSAILLALLIIPMTLLARETDNRPGSCDGFYDLSANINTRVRATLEDALTEAMNADDSIETGLRRIYQNEGATSKKGPFNLDSHISAWLHHHVVNPEGQTAAQARRRPLSFLAPSILVCGHCIGTDKMDHLFSIGALLWLERKAQTPIDATPQRIAEVFSMYTEGLHLNPDFLEPGDDEIINWFNHKSRQGKKRYKRTGWYIDAFGIQRQHVKANKWGNTRYGIFFHSPPSIPDHVANLAGLRVWDFFQDMIQTARNTRRTSSQFDICDWVTADMTEY